MSFVFYDTETTGKSVKFDQILQFAAILTDDELNEIDRFELRCRLDEHIVPSAGAFRVTSMSVDQVTDASLPSHYEMICRLRERLEAWCPATFVGWNTLRYDEELLRQAFYQCLHPPFLTNTNGSQRSDILRLAQCVDAFAKDVLILPRDEEGKPIYKLDKLAPANGFPHLNAHDAMADVEATIYISRLIKARAPSAWRQLLHCASKARVIQLVSGSPIYVLSSYSYQGGFREQVLTTLGDQPNGHGAVIAYDLTTDPTQLVGLTDEELGVSLRRQPSPIRVIKPNKAPMVTDAISAQTFGQIGRSTLIQRVDFLRSQPELVERILVLNSARTYEPSEHVEEQIYSGFPSPSDQATMAQFHAARWCDRYPIAQRFEDPRYRRLALRLISAHCPESLPPEVRARREYLLACRLLGHGYENAPWLTLAAADAEAIAMQEQSEPADADMLRGLRNYLAERLDKASAILGRENGHWLTDGSTSG